MPVHEGPLGPRNPYLNRVMIREVSDFYGRRREVAKLFARIGAARPQSIAIVGERRIGKSSLLNYVCRPEIRQRYLDDPKAYTFVLIDLQEQREIGISAFFETVFGGIEQTLGRSRPKNLPADYEGARRALVRLQEEGHKIILLFDEFDAITRNPNFPEEFFAFLRAVANKYDVAYVTTSGRDLQQLCHADRIADSPFFNIFSNLFLTAFELDDALALIREPSAAAGMPLAAHSTEIIDLAGLFPFFIQIACSAFFEQLAEGPGLDHGRAKASFLEEAEPHFKYICEHLDVDQRRVLRDLAEGRAVPPSHVYVLNKLKRDGYLIDENGRDRLFSSVFVACLQLVHEPSATPAASSTEKSPTRSERWRWIERLYHSALERKPSERAVFLTEACGSDEELRREVESLLAQERSADRFLGAPAVDVAARMIEKDESRESGIDLVGRQIGGYQILSRLGAGGMGEVYRARDVKLGRDVAIKVLPASFAADPERLRRFEREARVLAALNHPHIGAIHGFIDAEGVHGLVLELVEGPTLAERLAQGPGLMAQGRAQRDGATGPKPLAVSHEPGPRGLPLAEALPIARQIAEALEAAHEKGIVHRDLKPANIKLRPDGTVKVLDYGLAKAAAGDPSGPDLSQLPTMTLDGTRDGVILGTAAYMSPEQARGKPVDKRTDIWAFGCLLFEMLTGRVAFPGETISDTIVAILEREPDWSALPQQTPANIRQLLRRCLEKEPKRRLRDIGDAGVEIEEALAAESPRPPVAQPSAGHPKVGAKPTRVAWWAAAGTALLMIGGAALWLTQRSADSFRNPLDGAKFTRLTDFERAEQHAAVSRDGKFVAFVSDRDGAWDAWVSQIGTDAFHNLTKGGAPELRNPDLRTVGFAVDGSLVTLWVRLTDPAKGVSIDGWAVPTLGGQLRPYLNHFTELDWSPDGRRLVYHTSAAGDPMFVTEPDEKTGRQIHVATRGMHSHFPVWSPDGAFIYFVEGSLPDELDIWRIRSTGGEPERVTFHNSRVTFPTFIDNRMLVYVATADDGSGPWIYAVDPERGVSRRISAGLEEYTSIAASADGRRLVATVARTSSGLWRSLITDRTVDESTVSRVTLPTAHGLSPRIGPGYMLYRAPTAETLGIWKLEDGVATELWSGADGRVVAGPAIAPDGRLIAFTVQRRGSRQLFVMNADGSGARRIGADIEVRGAPAWSPDGLWIAIGVVQGREPQLSKIPIGGGAPVTLVTEYSTDPIWSPTGRFLVYSGADVGTIFSVKAVNADGTPHDLPKLVLSRGARRLAFLSGDNALVILKGDITHKEFWVFDIQTGRERQLTNLGRGFTIGDFDISTDGRALVFDRSRDESDLALIDLPQR